MASRPAESRDDRRPVRVQARPQPRAHARSAIAPVVAVEPRGSSPAQLTASTVRVNTLMLALATAVGLAIVQLQSALSAISMEVITGQAAVAGLGPALYFLGNGVAAVPAGRLMDRMGRVPGISIGFLMATAGAGLLFAGTAFTNVVVFLVGQLALGAGLGVVQLARAGAADMYPPERRGTGIGFVLVGAAVGAMISPILFNPLLTGRSVNAASLSAPWLLACAVAALGAGLVWVIRVDPLTLARGGDARTSPSSRETGRSLRLIYAARGARSALVAGIAAQMVMTSGMMLVSLEMRHHGHDLATISGTLAVHFVAMFGLSPIVGVLADRVGRRHTLIGGLLVIAAGVALLPVSMELTTLLPAMFALGLGWNATYLGATAVIADGTEPTERARALGAADLLSLVGAALAAALSAALLAAMGLLVVAALGVLCALFPAAFLTGLLQRLPTPARA